MAIVQTQTTSFKVDILNGVHNFSTGVVRAATTADTFKIALYTSDADLSASTTVYNASNEASGTGYTAGGNTLTVSQVPTSTDTTAFLSFSPTSWSGSSISARGALIYNSTQSDKSVAILDFGDTKTTVDQTLTIEFPTANSSSAIIRIE
jgi:hypothetical protein|tara:strand:- start:3995 stop:4444 length:450 start_codon:yes stop_codon:yes gene_type:complete